MKTFIYRFYVWLVLVFFYAPIFVLMVFSFNNSKSRTVWLGFTFDWYLQLFKDETIMHSVYVTLVVAVLAALLSTVLGTAAAIGIAGMGKRQRALIMNVTYIPVLSPEIITGVSIMLLFVWSGLKLGMLTLLLAHISFDVPFVILSVSPKLRQLDPHLFEAALDLGAKPMSAMRKVILPQIWPGVITGMLMAFTLSVDDFVISYFTSGPTSQTLSITIYAMTRKRVSPEINALSTLLFIVVLTLLVIVNLRQSRDNKQPQRKEEDVR
ncbi:MAG: ABC transporter permease [Clostridia bacterium]|nr:ABC transporter permease [Clostridia bacterium]MDR3645475.1 ABC transporter permease [Clostridia bacterium]